MLENGIRFVENLLIFYSYVICILCFIIPCLQDLEGCPKDETTSDSDSDSRCSSDDGSDVGHELGLGANSIHCYLAGRLSANSIAC